jgi:hypothetical protein
MQFEDRGMDIHGASDETISSIKKNVIEFRALHGLLEDEWKIKVYGDGTGYLTLWILKPEFPPDTKNYSIWDDSESGPKVHEILDHLYSIYSGAASD